jgi:cytochrome c biogenesis protein CcdA/thiol-disulfide isomerase/thioredoxin
MDVLVATSFALVAGAGTAVSPCVLPVLPLAVPGAATGGRRRPLGIAIGLAASFAFATLALAYLIDAAGLPDGLLRTSAIVVLLAFGLALMVPPAAARLETWLQRRVPRRATGLGGDGFGSGLVLGASLGLLYVPCAGPILAAVLTVQASQPLSGDRIAIGLGYAVGTAGGVLVVLLAGRRLLGRLRSNAGRLQQALGAVMVLVAVLTLAGADDRFRTVVADRLPSWLVSPAEPIEASAAAQRALGHAAERSGLGDYGAAPEIAGTQRWFNTAGGKPLTLSALRGRVVLIDFWTYTCINCIRTLPYVKAWDDRYRDAGLTVIGVHSPEFTFERDAGNVERAVRDDGIRYPVAQDNRFTVWNSFGNRYWPAKYLIDAEGQVRYTHFGEGEYEATERAIRTLLAEAGRRPAAGSAEVRAQGFPDPRSTPETYLGARRARGWVTDPLVVGHGEFNLPKDVPQDRFAFGGRWQIEVERATSLRRSRIATRFRARRVFLVMGPTHTTHPARTRAVRVQVDGRPVRTVRVGAQRLYTLVDLPRTGSHLLTLDFEPGISAYAFTFG